MSNLKDFNNLLSNIDLSFPKISLPQIPSQDYSLAFSEMDDALEQIQQQKQREFENQESLVKLVEEQNELLKVQANSLKNIDGNTFEFIKKFDELIASQYATEAIQSEMLEIIKNATSEGDYWEGIKSKLPNILVEKGADYLIAFIITAIKFSM